MSDVDEVLQNVDHLQDSAEDDSEDELELNNDDNEEVYGDDENLSERDDEELDIFPEDDMNLQNPEVPAEVEHEEMEVENLQEVLFKGVRTDGMRAPLEHKANLRAIDHLLVTLARTVRHNSTYEQTIDTLKWIKQSFRHINIPTTKEALWKTLGRNKEHLITRLFCSKCKVEIGVDTVVRRACACGKCGPGQDQSFVATFIQTRLRPQLIDLFKIPNMEESLRYKVNRIKIDESALEDVYDGEKYKRLSEPGNFLSNPNNYPFTLWTDGVKITKSSRATTYPVILQLNELSPHSRKKHLFLAGIWVADEHPILNTIMRPIVNELIDLYENGIFWTPVGGEERNSKFIVTKFVADSIARPDALRMTQFNGENGCTFCLAPGEMVNNTWVYRAEEYAMRTDASIKENGVLAIETGTKVNGVKGVSSLALLPEFDLVDGVPVDTSHNAFLGVAKRLVVRYLNDTEENWYIGQEQQTTAIDAKLLEIKTPTRISRQPRSISLYKMWKASEWRNWILYYALPCLRGILSAQYYNHLKKLCQALFILNSASITEVKFNRAEILIQEFVREYEVLYGLQNMVFNVHLFNHSLQSVRNWGPLWVYSALPFESLNRSITDYITSPYHRADQIVTRFFMKKFIYVAASLLPIQDETRLEIKRLLKMKTEHIEGMPEGHYFEGKGKTTVRTPNIEELNLVLEAGSPIHRNRDVFFYKKAIIHGTEYRVKDNVRRKFYNYIAYSNESRFYVIEKLIRYTYGDEIVAGIIGKCFRNNGNAYQTPHMHRVTEMEERKIISYSKIISPGFFIENTEQMVVTSMCNVWETD